MSGPLAGLRVLDLSRILAGPTCTQLLADMGADVIKVENPSTKGDDTRSWGPPFVMDADGKASDLSAYFVCANRNKRSVAIDLASAKGQRAVRQLAARSDVVWSKTSSPAHLRNTVSITKACRAFRRALSIARSPASARPGPTRPNPVTTSWRRPTAGSCRSRAHRTENL